MGTTTPPDQKLSGKREVQGVVLHTKGVTDEERACLQASGWKEQGWRSKLEQLSQKQKSKPFISKVRVVCQTLCYECTDEEHTWLQVCGKNSVYTGGMPNMLWAYGWRAYLATGLWKEHTCLYGWYAKHVMGVRMKNIPGYRSVERTVLKIETEETIREAKEQDPQIKSIKRKTCFQQHVSCVNKLERLHILQNEMQFQQSSTWVCEMDAT